MKERDRCDRKYLCVKKEQSFDAISHLTTYTQMHTRAHTQTQISYTVKFNRAHTQLFIFGLVSSVLFCSAHCHSDLYNLVALSSTQFAHIFSLRWYGFFSLSVSFLEIDYCYSFFVIVVCCFLPFVPAFASSVCVCVCVCNCRLLTDLQNSSWKFFL